MMQQKQVDLSFLDDEEKKPEVSVNLDFLDADPNQAMRDWQALKYGGGTDKDGNVIPPVSEGAKDLTGTPTLAGIGRGVATATKDLVGIPMSMYNAVRHPQDFIKNSNEAQAAEEGKAGAAWQRANDTGNFADRMDAVRHAVAGTVPFGPGISQMLDESAVDPAVGAGHLAGALLSPKAAAMLGEPVETLRGAGQAVKTGYRGVRNAAVDAASSRIEPHMQVFKAIRPKNAPLKAAEAIKGSMPEAARGAEITGVANENLDALSQNLDAAKTERIQQAKAMRAAGTNYEFDTTPVADAIKKSVPEIVRTEQPKVAEAVDQWADETYADKKMDIERIDKLRKGSNAKDAPYMSKLPNGQMNANYDLNTAISKARSDALRKVQYDGLDKAAGTGTGNKEVNLAIRDILRTEDFIDRRYNVEARQAIQNMPQQASKLMAVGKFGRAAKSLLASHPAGAAVDVLTGLGEVGIADFMKELNSTNGQIASAFRRNMMRQAPLTYNPGLMNRPQLGPAQSTVQSQSATGAATPGSLSSQSQWQNPAAIPLGAEGQFSTRNFADLNSFLDQERNRGRLNVMSQRQAVPPAEEPVIDADIIKTTPKLQMPASTIESDINARGQKLLPKGADRIIPMPESFTTKDTMRVDRAEFDIVRDPKTGRFKKVFKGTSGMSKEKK